MNLRKLFVAAGFVLAAGAVQAAEVTVCRMNTGEVNQGNWIDDDIYLIRDPATGGLQVMDGIIATFNKDQPTEAKITADTEAKRVFDWFVRIRSATGQTTKMQYHGTLFLTKNEFHVLARPFGFDNTFSAVGKCKPYTG